MYMMQVPMQIIPINNITTIMNRVFAGLAAIVIHAVITIMFILTRHPAGALVYIQDILAGDGVFRMVILYLIIILIGVILMHIRIGVTTIPGIIIRITLHIIPDIIILRIIIVIIITIAVLM
jgi:hypothetical protein